MNIGSMKGGAPSAAMMQEMRQTMFAKVDANSDGGIDKSEMSRFAKSNGLDTSKVDEMFQIADTDGSGSIDFKENDELMDKIEEKMKGMVGSSPSRGVGSSDSSSDTNDVLMQMLNTIRDHSKQAGGNESLKQFLNHLNQQSGSYGQNGLKASGDASVLLTRLA